MCLILVAWRAHPRYPLIVAANRDEYHSRPTAAADFWSDRPEVLAGRDLECGGTWLGVTRDGRFAAVTNFRDGSTRDPGMESRGSLTRDFLIGAQPPARYLREVQGRAHRYNGFGLLVGVCRRLLYCTNRDSTSLEIGPGFYGLSNHLLDTPWPKVKRGKTALAALVVSSPILDPEALLHLLADDAVAADSQLPDTGVGREWERALSAIFVRGEAYGTRASTVLLIDLAGTVTLSERSFAAGGSPARTVTQHFAIA